MSEADIIIYATQWCGDCRRARRFFDKHNIPYQWIDIDRDRQAEKIVIQTNQGMRSVPTIVFSDGSVMVEPSERQLAEKFQVNLG
ncbi:MAG: glutaredoxin domain-containing protein [Chloroflexota bacterium]